MKRKRTIISTLAILMLATAGSVLPPLSWASGSRGLSPVAKGSARAFGKGARDARPQRRQKGGEMKYLLLVLIRLYQRAFSPYWPAACRYAPSCSSYAYESVQRFGVAKGGWLALRRLARCRPLGGSGYDPVPGSDAPPAQPRSPLAPQVQSLEKTV